MKRFLKRFFLIVSIFALLLLAGAFVLAAVFQDAIGQRIVREINRQIQTELRVERFRLYLLRDFPSASLALKEVELKGTDRRPLLEAGEVSFRIGYSSIFGGALRVNSVWIANGALRAHVDPRGKTNYDIWKASEETEAEADFRVSLKKARLQNVLLIYHNEQSGQHISTQLESLDLSGEFSNRAFDLKTAADMRTNFLGLGGVEYLPEKSIGVDALLSVDLERGTYDFKKFDLRVEKNLFQLDGVVTVRPAGTHFDLFVSNKGGHLDDLVQLLPANMLERFGNLQSDGDFFFDGRIEGLLSELSNPDIRFKFGMQRGKLNSDLLPEALRDVAFEARFTNGKSRNNATSEFEIKDFQGLFGRQPLDFHLLARNLDDPQVDFALEGFVPFETIARLSGDERLKDATGRLEIRQLALKGRYSDMIDPARMDRVQVSGRVEFDRASLIFEKEKLSIERGLLVMEGNETTLHDLRLEGAGSDIALNGSCTNLLPYLLSDSTNARLNFKASWRSDALDIDRLFALAPAAVSTSSPDTLASETPSSANTGGWFASRIDGVFECQVKKFNFNKIEGSYFMGKLVFEENALLVEGSAEAMGGAFNLNGGIMMEGRPRLQARFDCGGVDAKEFFRQSDNFGQTLLQDRNLSGTLNAKMVLFMDFDENWSVSYDDILVFAGIRIDDGELKDFALLENMSTFVKVEDLRRIRFASMQNWLEIRKGKIYLPAMFIQSNALNLTVSGEHSFEQEINYNLKVNAGQVVANKFKKHNPSLEPIKAKDGLVNLYFNIFGTTDQFDYKTARREVRQNFAASEARKAEIRKTLLQAFGNVDLIEEPAAWGDSGEPAILEGF
jgi:hypothetical protein